MKTKELKTTVFYKVRDSKYPNGSDYTYKGISNFHSVGSALQCVVTLMDKHNSKRGDYVIVQVKRTESIIES